MYFAPSLSSGDFVFVRRGACGCLEEWKMKKLDFAIQPYF